MGRNIIDKVDFNEAAILLQYHSLDSWKLHVYSADDDDDRAVYYAVVDGWWGPDARTATEAAEAAIKLRDARVTPDTPVSANAQPC